MGSRVSYSAGGCIFLSLMILLLPLKWLVSLVVAAVIHELCHYVAMKFLGRCNFALRILPHGARMALPELSRGGELFCALAGPAGSLLLFSLASVFPRLALCGAIQGIFNLLPVYPMDGGRVLNCLLSLTFSPPMAHKIGRATETILCLALLALGYFATIQLEFGLLPLVFAIWVLLRSFLGKIPCKLARLRVQ